VEDQPYRGYLRKVRDVTLPTTRTDRRLRYLLGLHPFTGVATLSPHVADKLSKRLNGAHTHWMLPMLPAGCDSGCFEGFAVQGK
jgi:hypothetical protein